MMDNIIVSMSVNILGLALVEYLGAHHFALEALCAIISTLLLIYMQRKDITK